jgi:hypothetical protein
MRVPPGALALCVLLAGCAVALPDPATPDEAGHPWTETSADLWVARDLPCGFGSGAEEACATLTLLYRDGSVLRAAYGQGGPAQVEGYPRDEGNRSGLTFAVAEEDAAFRDEIGQAWAAMHGEAPDRVRVNGVSALRLDPGEREDVLRVVEHAVQQADRLGEPTFDCEDCSAPVYWTFGSPRELADQRFGSPAPKQDAWVLLEDQMQALHEWLDEAIPA